MRAGLLACAIAACGMASAQEQAPPPRARPAFAHRSGGDEGESRRLQNLSRFLVSRTRNLATLRIASGEVMAHVGKLPVDGPDFAALGALAPGAVLDLTGAAACKLRTDVDLRFGEVAVATGNVAPDFAGLYSFWLRAPEPGSEVWRLVFNDEADVWGTQRDPSRDRVEIPLAHEQVEDVAKELTVALQPGTGGESVLALRWGTHRWSAPFRASAPPTASAQ